MLLLSLMIATTAMAQKTGIVDVRRVVAGYKQMETINKELDKKRETAENDLAAGQVALQKERMTLDEKGAKLTEAEKKAFDKKVQDFNAKVQRVQNELMKAENDQMTSVQNKVNAAIKAVADTGKYDIILEYNAVLFAKEAEDVTPQVINQINK